MILLKRNTAKSYLHIYFLFKLLHLSTPSSHGMRQEEKNFITLLDMIFQSTHPLWDVTNKQRGILFFILSISKQASPTEYGAQNSLQVYENKP